MFASQLSHQVSIRPLTSTVVAIAARWRHLGQAPFSGLSTHRQHAARIGGWKRPPGVVTRKEVTALLQAGRVNHSWRNSPFGHWFVLSILCQARAEFSRW